ncbi:MAG: sulfatase-like hydrolase/transferase, partial [Gammaproteobacteria bacterium]|nr:sulfatase-like hydrolase/transferase [Gammaproteobacteria bacterium]
MMHSLHPVQVQLLLGLLLATCAHSAQAAADASPNIVVILADDLGVGDLGIYGSPIRTRHIDDLAQDGVQLTNFYASANVCTPSRAGLLTGRYPIRSGLASGVVETDSSHGLPGSETTIAEYLQEAGYRTAIVGKWHLGHTDDHLPGQHGFDYFFGVHYSNDMRPFALYENDGVLQAEADQPTLTRRYTEAAKAFIAANDERPFFLYLAHTFPHIPLHASDEFRGRSPAGIYGDSVEELDWSVGALVDELRDRELLDNTLII